MQLYASKVEELKLTGQVPRCLFANFCVPDLVNPCSMLMLFQLDVYRISHFCKCFHVLLLVALSFTDV